MCGGQQGLARLRGAIEVLTRDGDINGARELVADATKIFSPLGESCKASTPHESH